MAFRELQHCNAATASAERSLAPALPSASSLDEVNSATRAANKIKKSLRSIREPQSVIFTFAVSN